MPTYKVKLRCPHEKQKEFIESQAKRRIIKAGRRGGKTVGMAIEAVQKFLEGKRVLYGAPTAEQVETFWYEITQALAEPINAKVFTKNETEKAIELTGTKQRIRAKTCWNADTLRGDYADLLILDEFQLMNEDAWEVVGAPMLLDNDGDAVFIYTPPSLRSAGVTKAKDPRHASKLYQMAKEDTTGRWQAFHFTSHDNPCISAVALQELFKDMSRSSYRQEILAEDDDSDAKRLIYGVWNERTQRLPRFPIPSNWPIYSGHDFGGANPAALFFANDPSTGYFYAFQEYLPGGGRSTAQHVEQFKKIVSGYNVIKRAGGNLTTEDEIRQGYTAHGWPISAPKIGNVTARIDKVRGLMELNKVFVFEDLINTTEELMTYSWKLDTSGLITNDIERKSAYHLMDCMAYILSDFTPETAQHNQFARSHKGW